MNFKVDKQKQLLFGPFLIPNKLIYRRDEENGEYYVRFSKEEIEKIAQKFNKDKNHDQTNFMHTDEKVDGFVFQNWIIEGDNDKSKNYGFDLPEGTWFGAVKITDENFWQKKIKTNEVKGFSVEILADLKLSLKKENKNMKKKLELGSAILGDGTTPIYFEGEMIEVGTAIFTDEAMTMPASDDRWVLEDGRTIVVVGGVVESIEEVAEEAPVEEELAIDPNTGMEMPTGQITAEEVSSMIDNRFGEIMEEITRLKIMIEEKTGEMVDFKKEVETKLSTTPATTSIKKATKEKFDSKFTEIEAKVKRFASIK